MHAISHSLAHRAPPATRTRVRWQPYNSIQTSVSTGPARSPQILYPNTPTTVISSPPNATPVCDIERLRQTHHSNSSSTSSTSSHFSKDSQIRDTPKTKFALGLVDQAVKSLNEIWRPQDIPSVFITSSRAMVTLGAQLETMHQPKQHKPPQPKTFAPKYEGNRNTQLPSPVSPSTRATPPFMSSSTAMPLSTIPHTPIEVDQDDISDAQPRLVPIKGFVHEVLRRSRTSGSVLQTALCYLEAIRPQVPDLLRKERSGEADNREPSMDSRITPGAPEDYTLDVESEHSNYTQCCGDYIDTVRITETLSEDPSTTSIIQDQNDDSILPGLRKTPKAASAPPAPLPPLPSPLLCPRRAFLASLILASKFTQDKCYSNRAWAKLSGLPAREIGRCERALGEALQWRLWVGKVPVVSTASPQIPSTRPVVRSQSEGSLFASPPFHGVPAAGAVETPIASTSAASQSILPSKSISGRGLRRSSTLPSTAFAPSVPDVPNVWLGNSMHEVPNYGANYGDQAMTVDPQLAPSASDAPFMPLFAKRITSSPSPSTPGLSYSPSSTESSLGDHTIQMSMYPDDSLGMNLSSCMVTGNPDPFPWIETSEGVRVISPSSNCNISSRDPLASLGNLVQPGKAFSMPGCQTMALPPLSSFAQWGIDGSVPVASPIGYPI